MEAVFDLDGITVAWLNGESIHDIDGTPVALIRGTAAYNYHAEQFGFFISGFFFDGDGNAVGFIRDAQGGPFKPPVQPSPLQPDLEAPPATPVLPIPEIPPVPTLFWSEFNWDEFVD
jgi:hypothetical protein